MDLIERQDAIDAIKGMLDGMLETDTLGFYEIETVLFEVPSAEPEPLTDAEQRIFLKAISREKEVCKKTDEEYPGELNLVGVCDEIERKVKSVLWT